MKKRIALALAAAGVAAIGAAASQSTTPIRSEAAAARAWRAATEPPLRSFLAAPVGDYRVDRNAAAEAPFHDRTPAHCCSY
jgi:hypothetical protein